MSRSPFLDMLGNPVGLGDIVFRPTMRVYEKVVEIKPYDARTGLKSRLGSYQIRCNGLFMPSWRTDSKNWVKDGKNILKVNMTPEIESAFVLMDASIDDFQPKLILDFKAQDS